MAGEAAHFCRLGVATTRSHITTSWWNTESDVVGPWLTTDAVRSHWLLGASQYCGKEEVVLKVESDVRAHGLWEDSVDLMTLLPEIHKQLPSNIISRPVNVATVVDFFGLEINNRSAAVALRMSQSSFELSLALLSNPESDFATHQVADQVWTALMDTLHIEPCSVRKAGINV